VNRNRKWLFSWNKKLKPYKDYINLKTIQKCQKNVVSAMSLLVAERGKEAKLKSSVLLELHVKA
jgi:hypothetical protein